MCGLTGWFGCDRPSKHQRLQRAKALEALMLANGSRGMDASGVAMAHRNQPGTIYKRAVSSYKIIEDNNFKSLIRAPDAYMALGHTRLGTMGKNKDINAHPFVEKHVVGAHNGIIYNYGELDDATQGQGHSPLRVDSQVVFRLLAEVEPKPNLIAQVLPMIKGSLALTWLDQRDPSSMWVFRHDNPLSIALNEPSKTMFWSSQYDHLSIVMQSIYGSNWEPLVCKENTLYRFYWENKELFYEDFRVEMPSWITQPYKGKDNKVTHLPVAVPSQQPIAATVAAQIDTMFPVRTAASELSNDGAGRTYLEACDVCHSVIDDNDMDATFHTVEEGFMLCGRCDHWWENDGVLTYKDLSDAIEHLELWGEHAGAAVEYEMSKGG